jgi:ubiquinone/menaquinone biosynthesis C-methylase UbiE
MSVPGYLSRGTSYGATAVKKYAESHECSDMEFFLNKHIKTSLSKQINKTIIDAGCGAAPWSIFAGKFAKTVHAIDIQAKMIEEANRAIKQAGLSHKIVTRVGDATQMPYENHSFDHALSINVGCNLPPNLFDVHFKEISRVLKLLGTADISAPDSLDVLFTDEAEGERCIEDDIDRVLENLPTNPDSTTIQENLNSILGIVSATFVKKDNRVVLFTSSEKIKKGDPIWRKLSKVTIPNYYYNELDYLEAFKLSGLKTSAVIRERFNSEEQRTAFNKNNPSPTLGPSYTTHSPFAVYQVQKNPF